MISLIINICEIPLPNSLSLHLENIVMEKRWKLRSDIDEATVSQLAEDLKIDNVLAKLLVQRGINDFDAAKKFFRPSYDDLHDPFLMKDMDLAIDRLEQAISNKEKILVYGDYDVDGTTAVALVYTFLKNLRALGNENL